MAVTHPIPGIKAVIFDLDSTIRRCTVPGQVCPNQLGEQEVYPGWAEILVEYERVGAPIGFASNQGGVEHGYLTRQQAVAVAFETLRLLEEQGAPALHERCVRLAYGGKGSVARKPSPAMLFDLVLHFERYGYYGGDPATRLDEVMYVGDWVTDKEAAERAGVRFMWAWDFNPQVPVNEETLRKLAHTERKSTKEVLGGIALELRNLAYSLYDGGDEQGSSAGHAAADIVLSKARSFGWREPTKPSHE